MLLPVANLSVSSLQLHCMQYLMLYTRIDYEEMSIALRCSHYSSLIITVAVYMRSSVRIINHDQLTPFQLKVDCLELSSHPQ